jgi:plastocyanin domain-containing protein
MPMNPALCRSLLLASAISFPMLSPQPSRAEPVAQAAAVREVEVVIFEGTYNPNRIELHEGERLRIKFVRKEGTSCSNEVVFPQLSIRRELPLNKPVLIDLPPLSAGEYEFKCGMNMVRGTIVVMGHHHHG